MRKLKKQISIKFGRTIASLALMVTALNANSTCIFLYHQPELPEGAKALKKIK